MLPVHCICTRRIPPRSLELPTVKECIVKFCLATLVAIEYGRNKTFDLRKTERYYFRNINFDRDARQSVQRETRILLEATLAPLTPAYIRHVGRNARLRDFASHACTR